MYCEKCGRELSEDVAVCIGCGCSVARSDESTLIETKKKPKIKKLWIILGAVVLFIGIVAVILFLPRNLKMKDFKEVNFVTAIVQYGLPERFRTDSDGYLYLDYGDKHNFYGITPFNFAVYPDRNRVAFLFASDDGGKVYDKIERYCDFEKNLLNTFHKFSYNDLTVTTYDYDGSYVSIELN